ncbi:MAG: cytochrome c family protein [Planctomycetes bacterium]|nr:cytochrome c family protein [Planctomycetota bacterium]
MTPKIWRTSVATILLALLGLGFTYDDSPVQGQPKVPAKQVINRNNSFGADNCIACHAGEGPFFEKKKADGTTKFLRLDEYSFWNKNDLHQFAFKNIVPNKANDNLPAKMQEILRKDPRRGEKYEVARAAECLTCHSIDLSYDSVARKADPIDCAMLDDVDPSKARFQTGLGVSCEACHGFAEKWFAPHTQAAWREKSPEAKFKDGEIDMRSPTVRAERCVSCHVGNKEEGKFVTHDMYAAGHPPLPVFELATYSRQQPGHYHPYAKNEYFQDELKKPDGAKSVEARFHYREKESLDAAFLAQGAAAAFKASAKLLADDAAQLKSGELLDFAHFDCAACHHDLKPQSDRRNRTGGTPGRPLMRLQADLFDLVVQHASQNSKDPKEIETIRKDFDKDLEELKKAFDARPFGDPERIRKAAINLSDVTGTLIKQIDAVKYDAAGTRLLFQNLKQHIEKIGNPKSPGYIDHDTAQQFAWALLVLRDEIAALEKKDDQKLIAAAEAKIGTVLFPYIRKITDGMGPTDSVEKRMKERQEKQYGYESSKFFTEISDLLKLPPP